jgi:hypothetical protein
MFKLVRVTIRALGWHAPGFCDSDFAHHGLAAGDDRE